MRGKYFYMVTSAGWSTDGKYTDGLLFRTLVAVTKETHGELMQQTVFTVYENSDIPGYPLRDETCLETWTESFLNCVDNTLHLDGEGWSPSPLKALKALRRRAAHQGGWGVVRLCNKRLLTEAGHSRLSLDKETYDLFPNP